jgi:SWI/SNF-related matrix-associated actin-dependent regulator 1 of chromatin subfamily A
MLLTFDGTDFLCHVSYTGRDTPKRAGFVWRPDKKAWCTPNPRVAAHLREHADESAENQFNRIFLKLSPWVGRITYPEGLTPRPYQLAAAQFALSRNRSYLALDPGLGKTIVMALVLNARGPHSVVVVCPPGLVWNTERELKKWCTWNPSIAVYEPGSLIPFRTSILIVPDSFLADPLGSYSHLRDFMWIMGKCGGSSLFIDEAQRYGTLTAQRTRALMGERGLAHIFKNVSLLSGTPMRNRPIELFPVLSRFAAETIDFKNEHLYGMRYCAGYHDGYQWNYTGASNLKELAENVHGKFMLRLKKKDVLKELPAKTEELVFIDDKTPPKVAAFERKHLATYSPEDLMGHLAPNGHTSTYRRMLGLAKVKPALSYIKEVLEGGDEHILIFCEHTEVVEKMMDGLKKYEPMRITGATSKKKKQAHVDAFQAGKSRVLIGNIVACGTGFTLTRATRVVFVETSWVPADNEQASDRTHRIGQTEPVFVQYLVFKNSIDGKVIETNLRKRQIIDTI